ncbi:hypothetical protein BASA81_002047 [Batrachochytrium salamandrivorans]|nr:hypothetical protein BASA81_002047 [Batrachochytrium salamandrivorans]
MALLYWAVVAAVAMAAAKDLGLLGSHLVVLQPNGQVFGLGQDAYGQLGLGVESAKVLTPQLMKQVGLALDCSAGQKHTCIVDQGKAKCTGFGITGQLGNGLSKTSALLVQVKGLTKNVAQVFAAYTTSCALMTSGAAKCWGENYYGGLGDGTTMRATSPTAVLGFETAGVQHIAMGDRFTCFLTTATGSVLCSGYNRNGQLGDGTQANRAEPTQIAYSAIFASLACGADHACAVTIDGLVLCWGRNDNGQLGLGSVTMGLVPNQVRLIVGKQVTAAWQNTLVTLRNDTVVGFGQNEFGELGFGTKLEQHTPRLFAYGLIGVSELRMGSLTTCVVVSSSLLCVGSNEYGQMGLGSSITGSLQLIPLPGLPTSTARPTKPTKRPTGKPTRRPTKPTKQPTNRPTRPTTHSPTNNPTTGSPTTNPTPQPSTSGPTSKPSKPTPKPPTRKPTNKAG